MTPRPSDRAREALRAARGVASGDAGSSEEPAASAAGRAQVDAESPTEEAPHLAAASGEGAPSGPADGESRPADEAREALRRAVASAEGAVRGGASSPGGRAPRPSDAAREALHRARRARRGASAGEAGAASRPELAPSAGEAPSRDTEDETAPSVAAEEAPPAARPSARERPIRTESATRGGEDATASDSTDQAPHGHDASRPGDIAREALRAAREERARALAREQVAAAKRPRREPAPRVPRTTRGDRAADRRAREIRETLADAFRMPDMEDPAPGVEGRAGSADAPTHGPAGEPPDTRASDDPASAPETPRLPTGDRGAAPDTAAHSHGPASAADHQAPEPTPGHPRVPAAAPRDRGESPARPATATPPANPATPRSMAAPARDGDHRRTFPPFPPRPSDDGDSFAETWWGRAWVTALEDGALDPARLARGRGYAEQGHVDAITVTPGLVLAYVQGSRPRPYRVQVRLRTFDDSDWDRFLDAAADRPGHIAALLDKEMPQSLADCGVPLLPGPGDLAPRCSCPDSGHPCKHAAALCYQTARLLDADPFVLLLLRGRGEREVIDALSRLSAARAARAAQEREPEQLPGIRATDAVSRRGPELPPLPAPLPPPSHPEQPPVYPASPGGPDPFALDQLATDAAARAHALLTTGRDPVGPLSLWHDAVRLAAARPGSGLTAGTRALYASLARAAGRTPGDLARAVAAWRQGGPTGLSVLEEPWDPPAGRFDRARPLLLAADLPAFRPWRNRLTHPRGHVQLRLGRDHLWYAYESEPDQDDWWPRGTPDPDPVGALTGLDTLGDA
ncbi:SWIM zinc finger family protein [Streptomyces althioticus]|uniref:SWIM zinc finger family protein n=1 Tax=Streptomyces althioticus TaxID=83380 RepID=UPI0036F9AF0D